MREGYPTAALELVISGQGELQIAGKKYHLTPGTLFTYGPGIPHEIRADGSGMVKCFIDFSGSEAEELLKKSRLKSGMVALARHPDQMSALFGLLLERAGEKSPVDTSLCADYLRALLRLSSETLSLTPSKPRRDDCLRRAMTLIATEYLDLRSVADLAERLGVTPEHLTRTFKRDGLRPPSTMLNSKRMSHAAGLLLSGGLKIKQVAYELGFSSPFHFSAAFKRHFGHSPRLMKNGTGSR